MATSANGTASANGRVPTPQRPQPPPPSTNLRAERQPNASGQAPSAGLRAERQSNASGQAPSANSATQPATVSQLAAATQVPWGKFKGRTLAELSNSDEGRSYLYFLAHKSEAKNERETTFQAAAVEVVKQVVEEHLQAAIAQPDAAMPHLPFGDEKGKRLHQAHPKWVAMLAKKQDDDARSFADLVLYAAARHLQAERGPSTGFRRSGGLSDEQFAQLLSELKGIRVALEEVLSRAVRQ